MEDEANIREESESETFEDLLEMLLIETKKVTEGMTTVILGIQEGLSLVLDKLNLLLEASTLQHQPFATTGL